MESTVLTTISRRANLLTLVSSDKCPPVLKRAWDNLHPRLNSPVLDPSSAGCSRERRKTSNTKPVLDGLDTDIESSLRSYMYEHVQLSPCDISILNTKRIVKHRHYIVNDAQYMPSYASLAHSLAYIRESLTDSKLVPVEIREIFEHNRIQDGKVVVESFAAIHRFRKRNMERKDDPFQIFPDFRAALYHREPQDTVEVIHVNQIHCHANQRPWDNETVVMRAIDRVGHHYPFYCSSALT